MPLLENSRYEIFAQNVAQGKEIAESYMLAGYKSNSNDSARAGAGKLMMKSAIVNRVREIQSKGAKRAELKVVDIIEMLMEDRKLARERNQASAAIRAVELMGKQLGMFIEKKEVKTGLLDDADAGELDRVRETLIAEAARRIAEAGRPDKKRAKDRDVLSGQRAAPQGAISEAS